MKASPGDRERRQETGLKRIAFVSDTHMLHGKLKLPSDLDLLVHAGDFTNGGSPAELEAFGAWCRARPFPVICVAGNHELGLDSPERESRERARHHYLRGVTYLQEERHVVDGIRFWGSPRVPRIGDWAFCYDRDDRERWWRNVPECDVLITHGPPLGILDIEDGEHLGCWALREAVFRVKPKIHVFGHIHASYGMAIRDGVLFINASSCHPERTKYLNWPIVVDL